MLHLSNLSQAAFSDGVLQSRLSTFREFATPLVAPHELRVRLDEEWIGNLGHCWLDRGVFTIEMGRLIHETAELDPDELDLILCHELGHLLGAGARKKNNLNDSGDWAAGEGAADYFAGNCLIALWGERATVMRVESAAEGFFGILHAAYGRFSGAPAPSPSRRDLTMVAETLLDYPSLQCRMDSVAAGPRGLAAPACYSRDQRSERNPEDEPPKR